MPPQPLHIRPAIADDAADITRLVNTAYRPQAGEEGWTHESALIRGARTDPAAVAALIASSGDHAVLLTGLLDDALVACVRIEADADGAHIGMLAVTPARQTGGLGRRMLQAAEDWARTRFGATVALLTVIGERTELKAFYLRRGYRDCGRRLPYPADGRSGQPLRGTLDLHLLEKDLAERA